MHVNVPRNQDDVVYKIYIGGESGRIKYTV